MKKIIALLLVMAMVACLFVGCDNKDDSTGSPANEPASTGSDNPDAENTLDNQEIVKPKVENYNHENITDMNVAIPAKTFAVYRFKK